MGVRVFDFSSYKDYLRSQVGQPGQRRGLKSQLAGALHCQPTYISQVLNGDAQLSLEQAYEANHFFGHTPEEGHFFLLLVQHDRAGTAPLKDYFQLQIQKELDQRMNLSRRLGKKGSISADDQSRYYSSWHFAAIHIALTIPELRNRKSLTQFFRISNQKVNEVVSFLLETGLATEGKQEQLMPGERYIRIGRDAANIINHHRNWRFVALDSLEREDLNDLHYSGVMSLTKKDALKIKDRILENLKSDLKFVESSEEESLYVYCIDFFDLKR